MSQSNDLNKRLENLGYKASKHANYFTKVDTEGRPSGMMTDVIGRDAAEEFFALIYSHQRTLLQNVLIGMPVLWVKQWDEDSSFCQTCESFLEDDKYQCYCDVRNEVIKQSMEVITRKLEEIEQPNQEKES